MRLLIAFFAQRKLHTLFLVFLVVSISFFSMMIPLFFSVLTDVILPMGYVKSFSLLIGLLILLVAVRMLINFLQDYFFMKSRFLFEKFMILLVLKGALRCGFGDFERKEPAEVMARMSTFITNFQFNFSEIFYFFLYSLFVSSVVLLIIAVSSLEFFLLAILFLLIHYVNLMVHMKKAKELSSMYVDEKNRFNAQVDSLLSSKKVINIFGFNDRIERKVEAFTNSLYQKYQQRECLINRQELIQNLLKNLLFVLMVLLGVVAVAEQQLSAAIVLLCVLLIGFVYDPIYRLNTITKAYADCKAQLIALMDVAKINHHHALPHNPLSIPFPLIPITKIELRGIKLKQGGNILFQDLDLTLCPGKLYLIDGVSGAGKSSLLRLIAGVDRPDQGEVLWNDISCYQFLTGARPSIGFCPQQIHWADAGVVDNISLFSGESDLARVRRSLKQSACEFIDVSKLESDDYLANGWSGGQLRRAGLARALYTDASVLLLDEPTANIDADTEQIIAEQLRLLVPQRIVVISTHSPVLKALADVRIELGVMSKVIYAENENNSLSLHCENTDNPQRGPHDF